MAVRFWTKHFFAALVHTAAFGFLIGYAIHKQPLSEYGKGNYWIDTGRISWEPIAWKFTCKDSAVVTADKCSDSQKQFYVTKPDDAIAINIIGLASFYVAWSALGHYFVWFFQKWHREIRYVDYMLTAPTMLVVLAATYGMTSLWTLVNSTLLGLLLFISYFVERPDGASSSGPLESRAIYFYVLIAAYLFVISPIVYSAVQITNESRHPSVDPDDSSIGYGTAPDFVLAFAILTIAIFSCFVVPYAIDLLRTPLDNRESIYITLSMIAKTTLHLFLGLTVIETSVGVGAGEPEETNSEMDTLGVGIGGAFGLIIGLSLINRYGRLYDDSKAIEVGSSYYIKLLMG